MKYYILDYEFPIGSGEQCYDIDDGLEFDGVDSWARGRPFDKSPPNPIVIEMEQDVDDGDEWEEGLPPPPMFDGNMCLMSEAIVQILQAIPIENIDVYPLILKDPKAGLEWSYYAVNIIGLVGAADLDRSEWVNLDGEARMDTIFVNTVIDPTRTMGLDLFRLTESTGTIVISERVQKALSHISFLKFLPASL